MTNAATASGRIPGFDDGFDDGSAVIDGVNLHYWIGGEPDGDPVILWHGFLGTGYAWRHVAPALARSGMAVLIPDMRGYGDSDKPAGTQGYDGRALAAECRALAGHLGFGAGRKLVLAAHDMGAPPALLWAADHPGEIAGLAYVEEPVMVGEAMRSIITYTPEATRKGSLWWWLLTLAPGAPEALVVGSERAFLTWFYDTYAVVRPAIEHSAIDEYLRTFAGVEGVLGAMGVYRAAFETIRQTEELLLRKVAVPIVAIGGGSSIGAGVGAMLGLVATDVEAVSIPACGHFVAEEHPDELAARITALVARTR